MDSPLPTHNGAATGRARRFPVIHIGQRKTATSWLRELLQKVAQTTQTFEVLHTAPLDWSRENSRVAPEDVDWAKFTQLMTEWRGRDVFLTLETLIRFDHQRMAEALGEAMPGATILVTTRSPNGYLQSSYSHAIRKGRNYEPEQYAARYARNSMARTHDFKAIFAAYAAVFGPDAVQFLPFELLRDDRPVYLGEIAKLTGLPADALHSAIPDQRNAKAPEFFLALVKNANMRLWETDAEFADSREWKTFLRVAADSMSSASELWPILERFVRPLHVSFEEPVIPPDLLDGFREMQAPLANVPVYRQYLSEYGLAPAESHEPGIDGSRRRERRRSNKIDKAEGAGSRPAVPAEPRVPSQE